MEGESFSPVKVTPGRIEHLADELVPVTVKFAPALSRVMWLVYLKLAINCDKVRKRPTDPSKMGFRRARSNKTQGFPRQGSEPEGENTISNCQGADPPWNRNP